MHIRTATAAAAVALAATLAACSNSTGEPASSNSSKPAATHKPSPTAEAKPAGPRALGQPIAWTDPDGGPSGTATALSYRQPISGVQPPSASGETGEVWGSLEAKVCTKTGKVSIGQQPWSIAFADGSRVSTTGLSGGDFPRPEFPQGVPVLAGDCVRGLMMFPVPKGQRPVRVIYAPEGLDPREWKIPAK